MTIKINSLELENVKRVNAVSLTPSENGLTVIGGRNGQGKTSVLDAIAWGLGGKKFQPSNPQHEGSVTPPNLRIELSNGLIVERKGKASSLKVTDPIGIKRGQQILDELIGEMALNVPKFINADNKDKAKYLLSILGIEDKLAEFDKREKELSQERTLIGRERDNKKKYYEELPYFDDAPADLISTQELVEKQKSVIETNYRNDAQRRNLRTLEEKIIVKRDYILSLEEDLKEAKEELLSLSNEALKAQEIVSKLKDLSADDIARELENVEEINSKVRQNYTKEKAGEDYQLHKDQYDKYTGLIEGVRKARLSLLDKADMPLPGLTVVEGELIYNGQPWHNMSGSEQLRVATAIVRKLNPDCGFVLLDKLEQMDIETMNEFGSWLEQEGLQAIATRVSTGDECSIIIEDGYVSNVKEPKKETKKVSSPWGNGGF